MPRPRSGESRNAFINRFMASAEAQRDYPDQAQRFRVGVSFWDQRVAKGAESGMYSLYVSRPLLNPKAFIGWARSQGFTSVIIPEKLHATIVYSRREVPWFELPQSPHETVRVPSGGARFVHSLGDEGAVVLRFRSPELEDRHRELVAAGAEHGHQGYKPHVTITYKTDGLDISRVQAFDGELLFGPEIWRPIMSYTATEKQAHATTAAPTEFIKASNQPMEEGFVLKTGRDLDLSLRGRVVKVDREHRVVYGWFSPIEKDGVQVIDSQGDAIDEDQLLQTAHKFMLESRAAKLMHKGRRLGDVVESIVFSKDLQSALGIDLGVVGWFGGVKVRDDGVWSDAKQGNLPGFSIGGLGRRRKI